MPPAFPAPARAPPILGPGAPATGSAPAARRPSRTAAPGQLISATRSAACWGLGFKIHAPPGARDGAHPNPVTAGSAPTVAARPPAHGQLRGAPQRARGGAAARGAPARTCPARSPAPALGRPGSRRIRGGAAPGCWRTWTPACSARPRAHGRHARGTAAIGRPVSHEGAPHPQPALLAEEARGGGEQRGGGGSCGAAPRLQLGAVDAPELGAMLQREELADRQRHRAKVLRHDRPARGARWSAGGRAARARPSAGGRLTCPRIKVRAAADAKPIPGRPRRARAAGRRWRSWR